MIENRPWGSFEVLFSSKGYKVKILSVKPGETLSLQSHEHRHEHWVVVKGIATVTKNQKVEALKENEYIFIKKGDIHRIANLGENLLEIIEVQYGTYLKEDDITRYEDIYGRIP